MLCEMVSRNRGFLQRGKIEKGDPEEKVFTFVMPLGKIHLGKKVDTETVRGLKSSQTKLGFNLTSYFLWCSFFQATMLVELFREEKEG